MGKGDICDGFSYKNVAATEAAINELSDNCYLPANKILMEQILKTNKKFEVAFSISGITLELLQEHRPDVINSFRQLVNTGCVEILAETYYNSLSWLHSVKEFSRQVALHGALVNELFQVKPVVFRNTELIFDNKLSRFIASMGYKGILCEGISKVLDGRTPNQVYATEGNEDFGVLLRNTELSDDIAFRFGESSWSQHPLTAEKFAEWLHQHPVEDTSNINILFDYETFGMHKNTETGIFNFLESLPAAILANDGYSFKTPTKAIENSFPKGIYDAPQVTAWRDKNSMCCVWCENMMQNNTIKKNYSLEKLVMDSEDKETISTWGMLQQADNFYFMGDTERCEGDSYKLNNPFSTPKEAFQNYSNILTGFELRVIGKSLKNKKINYKQSSIGTLY